MAADGRQPHTTVLPTSDELDAKIEKIDEIVYDLYDLTDEEIEIVEETVAEWRKTVGGQRVGRDRAKRSHPFRSHFT